MAPSSPKRRKLNHDSDISSQSESQTDSDSGEMEETPQQQTHTRSSKPTDISAMYAGDSYKSSMFKLQVDEMLAEIRPNYEKRFKPVNDALLTLKTSIEAINARAPLSIPDAVKAMRKSKVVIPFPDPKPDANAAYKLAYEPPLDIDVIGSYVTRTMVKSDTEQLSVDLLVTIPESLFTDKDYLNYRYFYKRAYYLACIAAGLNDSPFDIQYDTLNGNDLQPILLVKGDFKCFIRIIPAAPEGIFADNKLRPSKNAVRPTSQTDPLPTPFYNATIKSDQAYASYLKLLRSTAKQADGFKDACMLGRVWLKQRGFSSSIARGGFGAFEWAALTALLLQGGGSKDQPVLSPGYSSYQLFKAVVQYLGSKDLASKPVLFKTTDIDLPKSSQPIFYDGPRGLNILYKMTPSSYAALFQEGKLSLQMLNDATFDQFESTFIIRKDHQLYQFDNLITIKQAKPTKANTQDHQYQLPLKVFDILKEGLGDRTTLIHINSSNIPTWDLNSVPAARPAVLKIGFINDPANINRLVDHGPPAEEKKKAVRFQAFWGEKAELRRFRDGSILESVVWSNTAGPVFNQIVSYLIDRHIVGAEVEFLGDDGSALLPGSASTTAFTALRESYKVLENDIRGLDQMPLQLKQLSAISPQLRFSSVKQPALGPGQHTLSPAEVIIQFEGSGRWPDDVVAIQRTKIAFLLKIASLLESSVTDLSTKLGIENTQHHFLNCAFLDIFYPSGATFRLRVQNDREEFLLARLLKDKTTDAHTRSEAAHASLIYKQTYTHLPLLTASISTHCTRYTLLSPTIRLLKKWFESHMLASHFPPAMLELLACRTFLQPYPWSVPTSTHTAFLRTLHFLSRWDWRSTPLVVDFSGQMNEKDIAAVQTRLQAWRKLDPAMNRVACVVATNHDTTGTVFTDGKPSKVIASRMTHLARSAVAVLSSMQDISVRDIFTPSLADFDFTLHVSSKFSSHKLGTAKKGGQAKYKNLALQSGEDRDMIGYEPIESFVEELEQVYGNTILFFQDRETNRVIGGVWNPAVGGKRKFRVGLGWNSIPCSGDTQDDEDVGVNKEAILSEIARLGGDLITRIDIK